VGDEAVNRIGAMLEDLGARFELAIEAISGLDGRLDALRGEMCSQISEVGSQIRFLSEQIAENRQGVEAARDDIGAEVARLGEALGKARIEFREELSGLRENLRGDLGDRAARRGAPRERDADSAVLESTRTLKREIAAAGEMVAKKLGAEIKQTNKSLASLARKFERFDDRITIETRDQGERIRKLERKGRA
jgi:hypothetical protein